MRDLVSAAGIIMLLAAVPSIAQEARTSLPSDGPVPRVEVGGGVGTLGDSVICPSLHARVNLTHRVGIEAVGCPTAAGFYLLQAHHTFGVPSRVTPFATFGVVGGLAYERVPEYRRELDTGDIVVYRAHTERSVTRPLGAIGGGGFRVRLASHAFLEAGAQLLIVETGAYISTITGVSVPIGRGR